MLREAQDNAAIWGAPSMSKRTRISARAILSDIRSETSASDLMEKYGLSSKGLLAVFNQLISARLIDAEELSERYPYFATLLSDQNRVRGSVLTLSVPVPILDVESSAKGILRDVSTNEIRVAGVKAQVGQVRIFRIPVDMFMAASPLRLVARCTSVETKGGHKKYTVAGFEVVDLTKSQRETLDRFIRVMFLSSSGEWRVGTP